MDDDHGRPSESGTTAGDRAADALRDAFGSGELNRLGPVLADGVRWYGAGFAACHSRDELLAWLGGQTACGVRYDLHDVRRDDDRILVHVAVSYPGDDAVHDAWQVATLNANGLIVDVRDYTTATSAEDDLTAVQADPSPSWNETIAGPVPFIHVTSLARSIAFYELLGFRVRGDYRPHGEPVWASLASDDARMMLAERPEPVDPGSQAVLFYLYSDDLEGLRSHLRRHGVTPSEIVDGTPGPRREMRVSDPDGYCLMIARR